MPKPGALNPTIGQEYTLQASEPVNDIPGNSGFRIAVTVAGSLEAIYKSSSGEQCELHYPVAGVYLEPGSFKKVWKSAAAPTTLKADTIVLVES